MDTKKIESVVPPPAPHFVGDGFRVHGFIQGVPLLSRRRMDPFLVLDYNSLIEFPASEKPRGVGVHPHKGFETVTIAYRGSVAHHDSSGGGGVIGQGGVQWMTAGSGVLHKEYHEEEFSKAGGEFQMVQLWVNLPAKDKNVAAKYQALSPADMGRHQLPGGAGHVEVIAGEYEGTAGPARTFSPVHLYNAKLRSGARASFAFPASYTCFLLVIEGHIRVNGDTDADTDHLLLFANEGTAFTVEATTGCVVLVAAGEPLREPIAAYGPFVMNTQEELAVAFNEFNAGKFGALE